MTDTPSPYRTPAPPELSWWWRLEGADGREVAVTEEYAEQRFASQGDAESWVGEWWRELSAQGVTAVVLHEHDRAVYGPMSLEA